MTDPAHLRKLAELERLSREQDQRSLLQDARDLSGTLAAQADLLARRLEGLGLLDMDDDPDEEIEIGTIASFETGEVIVAIGIDSLLYWLAGTKLIAQREAKGRVEYAEVGEDGEFGEWKIAPPPPRRSQAN